MLGKSDVKVLGIDDWLFLNMQQQLFYSFFLFLSLLFLHLLSFFSHVADTSKILVKLHLNAHIISLHQQTDSRAQFVFSILILSFFLFRSKTHHMLRRWFLKHLLQAAEWDVKLLNAPVLLQVLFSVRRPQGERRRTSVLSFFRHLGSISWLNFHCSGNQIFQPPHESREDHYWETGQRKRDTVRERKREWERDVEEEVRGTVVVSRRPNQTDKPRTALKEEKKKKRPLWTHAMNFLPVNTIVTRRLRMPKLRVSKALQLSKT